MNPDHLIYISACIGIVAFLYSSVGHAGASGYIAIMALFSRAPSAIKPTALVLNILVACIGHGNFGEQGIFLGVSFGPLPSYPFRLLL